MGQPVVGTVDDVAHVVVPPMNWYGPEGRSY